MATWIPGRTTARVDWAPGLHSLRVEAEIEPFVAGQFIKFGLEIDGEILGRPYSLVNSPESTPLEIYFGVVSGGPLSARLAQLNPGDPLWVAPRAAGFLTLAEVPDGDTLWLLATGTGLGPFLSMLKSADVWQRFRRIVLVHGARSRQQLAYAQEIVALTVSHLGRLIFVPVLSRESLPGALSGRIPAAITDGRLEKQAGLALDPESARIMLCGNPAMLEDATNALQRRGFKKHRRRDPGQILVESYW